MPDLGSGAERRKGSSPFIRTSFIVKLKNTTTMRLTKRMKGWAIALMAAFPLVFVSCNDDNGNGDGSDFTPSAVLLQTFQEDFPQVLRLHKCQVIVAGHTQSDQNFFQ